MKQSWIMRLAFRNLLRYGRRTLITASAIAFGLIFFVYVDSILEGADDESKRNLRRYETADAAIASPGFMDTRDNLKIDDAFSWEELAAELEADGIHAAPRIPLSTDLIFYRGEFPEDGYIPARLIALDSRLDTEVFRLQENLVEGSWLKEGQEGVILGSWLARDIGAKIGSWLTVSTDDREGFPAAFDLQVVGILNSPNPEVNRGGAYMDLDVADEILEMNGEVPVLHVRFPGLMPMDGIPERYAESVGLESMGLEWVLWEELAKDYVLTMEAEKSGSASIIMLILIIAAVGISNTMLMAVMERHREVGMMRSLGMNNRHIRRLFLWESAGIGLVGSLLGTGLGALMNIPLVRRGLDFSFFFQESTFGYRTNGIFYGSWHLQGFLAAFALGLGLSVLVAAVSIRRILKISIVASLRYT